MSIKISGTTVIDDSRNINSVGILTVGTGSSRVTLNGITGIASVGSGVTMNGNNGNVSISGILTVGQLSVPISVISFDPGVGSTTVELSSNIILNFNQTVGFGTTGFFEIKTGLNTTGGTLVESLGVSSSRVTLTNGGRRLTVDPTINFGFTSSFYVTMSAGFVGANGSNFAGINTVGSGITYSFTTKSLALGDSYEGGFLICKASPVRWVVSPSSSEVSRNWYSRNDANTTAQSVSGCTGWFVPSCAQLQNPGYVCRTYWDSYTATSYYSNTENSTYWAWSINLSTGLPQSPLGFWPPGVPNPVSPFGIICGGKAGSLPIRSFRCVSY